MLNSFKLENKYYYIDTRKVFVIISILLYEIIICYVVENLESKALAHYLGGLVSSRNWIPLDTIVCFLYLETVVTLKQISWKCQQYSIVYTANYQF